MDTLVRVVAVLALAAVVAAAPTYADPAAPAAPAPAVTEPVGVLAYTADTPGPGFGTQVVTVWTDGTHRRVVSGKGDAYDAAWSPDGSRLAFGTNKGIGVVSATGGDRRVLVADDDASAPSWSPDGTRIAYAAEDGLRVLTLATGASTVVVPVTPDWLGVSSSTWSPDGGRIAFTRISADGDDYSQDRQLWVVGADGSGLAAVPQTAPYGDDPHWSPDGAWLLYTEHSSSRGGEGSADVHLVHPDGTGRTSVLDWEGSDFGGGWSPDGTRIAVSSDGAYYPEMYGIWTLRPDGTDRELVVREGWDPSWRPTAPLQVPVPAAGAARGPAVAYVAATEAGYDLFTVRPDGSHQRRLTTSGDVMAPAWSPDHRTLAFVRHRSGRDRLWTVRADGTRARLVSAVGTYGRADLAWSPDGRRIAYGSGPSIVVLGVGSGTSRSFRVSRNDVDTVVQLTWSPDGRRIAYALTDSVEATHLWTVSAAGGPSRRVTTLTGSELDPAWSPDGRRLVLTHARGPQGDRRRHSAVVTVRLDGSDRRVLAATRGLDDQPAWSPDGRRVALRSDGRGTQGVWVVSARGTGLRAVVLDRSVAYVDW